MLLVGVVLVALLVTWQALLAWRLKPPSNPDDLCAIFREQPYWYAAVRRAERRFGVDAATTMAVLAVESGFRRKASPPRRKLWGWLPWTRPSSAYGYAQATKATWRAFETAEGRASRSDPRHAVEFVAWYFDRHDDTLRARMARAPTASELYAAYHQGAAGFFRGTWRSDPAALRAIKRFESTRTGYLQQLDGCSRGVHQTWLFRTALRWLLLVLVGATAMWWLVRGGARRLGAALRRRVTSARR